MKKLTSEQAAILNYKKGYRGHEKSALRVTIESMKPGDICLYRIGEDMENLKQPKSIVYELNANKHGHYTMKALADGSGVVITRNI